MKSFNVPLVVKKFSENIMSFKKSIQDLNNTITEMSLSESKLKEDFRILQLNISNLKVSFLVSYLKIMNCFR